MEHVGSVLVGFLGVEGFMLLGESLHLAEGVQVTLFPCLFASTFPKQQHAAAFPCSSW